LKKRPIGVTVVAVLTMFVAFAFGFLQMVVIGLMGVGGSISRSPSFTPVSLLVILVFLSPGLAAFFAFGLSIAQFDGARWAWRGSMIFWVLCLIVFGYFAYRINFSYGIILLVPLFYAAGCIRIFLTRNVRDYFLTDFPTNK
jgi:hypothetical protein